MSTMNLNAISDYKDQIPASKNGAQSFVNSVGILRGMTKSSSGFIESRNRQLIMSSDDLKNKGNTTGVVLKDY